MRAIVAMKEHLNGQEEEMQKLTTQSEDLAAKVEVQIKYCEL